MFGMGSNRFGQLGAQHATTSNVPLRTYHEAAGCAASARASDGGVCGSQLMDYTKVFPPAPPSRLNTTRLTAEHDASNG